MPEHPHQDSHEPAGLDIRAGGIHRYDVTITHGSGATTRHCVSVPERLLADLGVSAAQEPLLVRASMALLLEHEPASLPERFSLADIDAALPDYHTEVLDRL